MEYEILKLQQASELKKNAKFLDIIDFNYAKVYLVNDSSYLVIPFFPFGNSLYIHNKTLLDKFVNERHFPVDEDSNKFYIDNKKYIDGLGEYKDQLKEALIEYVFNEDASYLNVISGGHIDQIYGILKARKAIKRFKLHFMFLLGDYLIGSVTKLLLFYNGLKIRYNL